MFKSDNYNSTPVNQVLGKCYVMPVRDYFKSKPEGFDDKDVYVCESRYSAKAKAFKKIKVCGIRLVWATAWHFGILTPRVETFR